MIKFRSFRGENQNLFSSKGFEVGDAIVMGFLSPITWVRRRFISSMLVLTLKKKNNRMKLLKGKKGKTA